MSIPNGYEIKEYHWPFTQQEVKNVLIKIYDFAKTKILGQSEDSCYDFKRIYEPGGTQSNPTVNCFYYEASVSVSNGNFDGPLCSTSSYIYFNKGQYNV